MRANDRGAREVSSSLLGLGSYRQSAKGVRDGVRVGPQAVMVDLWGIYILAVNKPGNCSGH